MKNLKVSAKILLLVGSVIVLMSSGGAYVLVQGDQLGGKFDRLVTVQLPLVESALGAQTGIYAQQAHFERMLRYSVPAGSAAMAINRMEKSWQEFIRYQGAIEKRFGELREGARSGEGAQDVESATELMAEIESLSEHHARFVVMARQAYDLVQSGKAHDALVLEERAEATVAQIDLSVEKITGLIAKSIGLLGRDASDSRRATVAGSLVGLLAALVISISIGLLLARRITRPLTMAVQAVEAIAQGDFSQRIEVGSGDEIGQLGHSLNETAGRLGESQVSMARSQNLVDNAPINIMMADRDLNLIYVNPASLKTFKKLEHLLPCKASEMLGKSIDIFHKDPAHQRGILSDPNNLPYHAQIQLGPEYLDLDAAAILDREGNYLGPMVSWMVVTEQKKIAEANARSQNLVENAPINIMMADRDMKLIYINPASLKTFKKLEHLLPCKASEMLGRSIDIFHKNPAHQRRILSDPNNLPYHAQIQLGPEYLDLDAAAILDKDGNYLGPMVSWTVVTEQKKAKDRDLQVQSQVAGIAAELNQSSTNLVAMSNTMAANAEENSTQANNVSAAAEEVSANVSSVAAAVEEMSATIQEVSRTVIKSSEVTQKAVQMSKKASGLVTQLGESSNEISQVTKVIASIAQQTNILALNATIEAARAGEAGKGFAVVANEVKELAKSTSKMTEDISTRIAGIQQSTGEAVLSIEEINRIMSEVDTLSSTVASAVEEQSATTNEISRSMTEASTGVNEIVRNISGMADAAKDTSKQALSSKEGAENLGQLAARLQEIVELFAASNAAHADGGGNGHAKAGNGKANGGTDSAPAHDTHSDAPPASTMYS